MKLQFVVARGDIIVSRHDIRSEADMAANSAAVNGKVEVYELLASFSVGVIVENVATAPAAVWRGDK